VNWAKQKKINKCDLQRRNQIKTEKNEIGKSDHTLLALARELFFLLITEEKKIIQVWTLEVKRSYPWSLKYFSEILCEKQTWKFQVNTRKIFWLIQ
jgi:hypothetical protein